MTISADTQARAEGIIRAGLDAQFRGKIKFADVRARPMLDQDEEEFLNVSVVYEGDRKSLEPGLCNSLYQEIEDQLLEIGVCTVPSISYIDKLDDVKRTGKTAGRGPAEQT